MENGILLINKPVGISSYDAIRHIKRLLPKGTKIGHAGTLDPLAEGLLIVGIGRSATKTLGSIMLLKKTYEASGILGKIYDSQDITGTLIEEHSFDTVRKKEAKGALKKFVGKIEQIPPMHSALKHKGKPLYKLAREGREIDRKARPVRVYKLRLKKWSPPDFQLRIVCSSGTYVRTLIHDIGSELGVGASMSALKRTRIGKYSLRKAHRLDTLTSEVDIITSLARVD